ADAIGVREAHPAVAAGGAGAAATVDVGLAAVARVVGARGAASLPADVACAIGGDQAAAAGAFRTLRSAAIDVGLTAIEDAVNARDAFAADALSALAVGRRGAGLAVNAFDAGAAAAVDVGLV